MLSELVRVSKLVEFVGCRERFENIMLKSKKGLS